MTYVLENYEKKKKCKHYEFLALVMTNVIPTDFTKTSQRVAMADIVSLILKRFVFFFQRVILIIIQDNRTGWWMAVDYFLF